MIGLLLALSALGGGRCPLAVVVPAGTQEVAVEVEEGRFLPVGSLVRHTGERCEAGEVVEVVAVDGWVRLARGEVVEPGASTCLPSQRLEPLGDRALLVQSPEVAPPGPLEPGDLVEVEDSGGCEADDADLASLRPLTGEQLRAARRVQAAFARHFGEIRLDAVPVTEWGYVGLPFSHLLTPEEIEVQWEAESLVTEEQREKATSALGPGEPEPAYTHFTGADPHLSDFWGEPEAVVALLELAASWYALCTGPLAEADGRLDPPPYGATPRTCTLQVGDLAWYSPRTPDPLGHVGHHLGRCADIRLFRTDGSRYEAWWNQPDDRPERGHAYARNLTGAFAHHALSTGLVEVLYFNDPAVVEAVDGLVAVPGHDDHLHLCFGPVDPTRP